MLILTRRPIETIVVTVPPSAVPTKIEIHTLGVKGNHVRVGVTAPRHVTIDREEIYRRKQGEIDGNKSHTG